MSTLSREVDRKSPPAAAANAAPLCVAKFRNLKDSRGLGSSFEEQLAAAIKAHCDPGAPGVTHALADILEGDTTGTRGLNALNLDAYCTSFGGDGEINSLEEWKKCVVAASKCAADAAIAVQYPLVLDWLDLARPAIEALVPPQSDPNQIVDALAALDTLNVAIEGPHDDNVPEITCGLTNTDALCGNGIVDPGEECDWTELNDQTCADQGFEGGTLACTPGQCTFDVSGCSAMRFIDNGNGTITDFQTGLMWEKKDVAGGLHDKNLVIRWQDELPEMSIYEWLAELNGQTNDPQLQTGFAGYTDWRIPTIDELQTILDLDNSSPAVDPIFNTNCTPDCTVSSCSCTASFDYWSSTTTASNPLLVWKVLFFNGNVSATTKDNFAHVRAVRGGR